MTPFALRNCKSVRLGRLGIYLQPQARRGSGAEDFDRHGVRQPSNYGQGRPPRSAASGAPAMAANYLD